MLKLIVLLAVLNLACGQQFWSQCTHQPNIPTPHRIITQACDNERCRIVRGQVANPTAYTFFSGVHVELRSRVTAFILGIGIDLPLPAGFEDGCDNIFTNGVRTTCPVQPNIEYSIGTAMEVPTFFPAFTNTRVRIEFIDRGVPALCLEFIGDLI